jgi:signal transduction histidine kinase
MTAKGRITSAPQRRLRLMVGAQIFWLAIVLLLGAWWCSLVLRQAGHIAELETRLGLVPEAAANRLRTNRMVFWESITYFTLLVGSSIALFRLYWRDVRRSRGVQAFFAAMTHELRTPLASIRLQAEAIGEGLSSDPSQKAWVDRLLQDTLRLESQVERTLELARVEGGGPVYPDTMELKPWLDRWVSTVRDTYGPGVEPGFSIQARVPDDLSVVADPTALGVVMRNLIENSVRHGSAPGARGGGAAPALRVTLEATPAGGGTQIAFRDNGPSYAGDTRRLGEIFEKGAGSSGTGVGLYLVRVLTEQMGGRVTFAGGPGFEVRLWLRGGESSSSRKGAGDVA